MIFEDASIGGFEPDARLTAMWLWTLAAPANETALGGDDSEDDSDRDVEDPSKKSKSKPGLASNTMLRERSLKVSGRTWQDLDQ